MNDSVENVEPTEKPRSGLFSRLRSGLVKTRDSLVGGLDRVVRGKAKVGPELLEEVEEILLSSDVGVPTTRFILEELRTSVTENRVRESDDIMNSLKEIMVRLLQENQGEAPLREESPFVVLVVGVNGSGKTTTIAKLTQKWKNEGKKVILAAADTFRAAAIEQMQVWAQRLDVPCIHQKSGADPSAVAYDAVQAAVARNMDIVIIDTAGRLQTNTNLMEELKKVKRVIGKMRPGAPHETLLVLDATIGQNSISQAKLFHEAMAVDGLVMTKLDGTSKGGVLFNISRELKLPVRFIGVGEKADDLQPFDPRSFVEALFDHR